MEDELGCICRRLWRDSTCSSGSGGSGGQGVLDAGDVDRDKVLADLGPLDRPRAGGGHVKDLGPQPADRYGTAEYKQYSIPFKNISKPE